MAYTPKFSRTEFVGGKNILASEILQYVHGGATLDATAFPVGKVEVGTLVARNTTSGKYEPYAETTPGTLEAGFDNFYVLNEDFINDGENDVIVGAVLIEGSVYQAKLPVAPSAAFKAANPNIHYVLHI